MHQKTMFDHCYCIKTHFVACILLIKCLKTINFCITYNGAQKYEGYLGFKNACSTAKTYLYPRYEVYRGYIVFAISEIMFVCVFVCLPVNFFSVKDFSATTWVRILKIGTKLASD